MIVAVHAEKATGHEADSLPAIIDRARWARHQVTELCADQGYASDAVYRMLEAKQVTAFVSPQPNMLGREPARAARRRCKRPPGVGAAVDRMTHGEGAISELKLQPALDRARCRSTAKLQLQLLLAATAVNLKRLLSRPQAASGCAGGDHAAARQLLAVINARLRWLDVLASPSPAGSSTAS
ncbi:MAG: transposase [Actinomycetota bacterium]|nr:transposase [Actinomycetota bacterium]